MQTADDTPDPTTSSAWAAPAAAETGAEAARLFAEREKRITDAIALRKPDRVPVWHGVPGPYPSERLGISREEQMMDPERSLEANFQTALFYQSDMVELMPPIGATLAPLGYRHLRWAGQGLPGTSGWQFVDEEVMRPEEYDEFLYDPSDFIVRKYWPRAYSRLAGLAHLLPLREGQGYFAAPFAFFPFGTPAGLEALEALREAAAAALRTVAALAGHGRRLAEAGFPLSWSAFGAVPFDLVGDFLRGRKGVMLDMFRCPEKLEAAAEKMLPMAVEMAVRGARMSGNPRVFIAVHGGVEGFMSVEQYKRFYWPTFQAMLAALCEAGLYPFVLVEGRSDSRLEIMAEVPAGKICYWFDHVDMRRAKEVVGGTACIAGNVPISLLSVGTPDDVRAYCKGLIDSVGREGGFILGPSGQTEDVKIENVKAMVDFAKEYGV
jgi:uroporphyrinogen-III decarboxylase